MKTKVLWGLTYLCAIVTFISLILWLFGDSMIAKWICIFSIITQIYGILTMDKAKKT